MIDSRILFNPEHMSVAGRNAALDYMEQQQAARTPGRGGVVALVVDADAYPRIYRLGGFVAPYAGDSTGFVESGASTWVDRRALLFRLRVRLGHERLRRAGRPARRRCSRPGDVPVLRVERGHDQPAAQRESASSTSTPTASPTTACTPTGWRTSSTWPAPTVRRLRVRPGPGRRGLPPDVGALLGRGARLVPQTRAPAGPVRAFTRAVDAGLRARALMQRVGQPWQRFCRACTYCARKPGERRVLVGRRAVAGGPGAQRGQLRQGDGSASLPPGRRCSSGSSSIVILRFPGLRPRRSLP